jgi:putative ABC transport system permease protein
MNTYRVMRQGFASLGVHKLRTFFMMVGTIVGIAALVVIMAVGKATNMRVMQRVNNFGPRAMMLIPGGGRDLPPPDPNVKTLMPEDAEAVRRQVSGLALVSPMTRQMSQTIRYEDNQFQAGVFGVESNWHDAWNWETSEGVGILAQDVATMNRVCVIGETVRRELFGDMDPLEKRLYAGNISLTVKGVLEKRGVSPGGGDMDARIIIPITTAMRRVFNVEHLSMIRIVTEDPALMPEQARAIRTIMREQHHIGRPEEDDFRIVTPLSIAEMVRGISGTLSTLLTALAGLSLLVGGIVLMNILLISVTERRREIGLRRAVGAKKKDILLQFLTESLSVSLLGMIIGGLIGLGITLLLVRTTALSASLSWESFLLGAAFALLVGLLFGVHPARRAAGLHPVDALR